MTADEHAELDICYDCMDTREHCCYCELLDEED